MLDNKLIKKVTDFVYQKPRTIQEIAHLIQKNWRTADRYIEKISLETGLISARTFRGGTRGALKIVYWNNIEKIYSSSFQERLFTLIQSSKFKEQFSPLEIYQYVDDKKRKAVLEVWKKKNISFKHNYMNLFSSAEQQILCFSGNLSWINLIENNKKALQALEAAAKLKIPIKILSRIEFGGLENVEKVMEINNKLGREAIEIRHCFQPLRGFIIDNKMCRLIEQRSPEEYKKGELKHKMSIFYEIYDEEWIEWLQKIFWNLFRSAIPAEKRLKDLNTIRKLKQ